MTGSKCPGSDSGATPCFPLPFPRVPCVTLTLTPGLRLQDITSLVRVITVNTDIRPVRDHLCTGACVSSGRESELGEKENTAG